MAARKVLDYVFTQSDLYWLDHLLPDEIRREKEDAVKKHVNGKMVSVVCKIGKKSSLPLKSESGSESETCLRMRIPIYIWH